MCGRSAELFSVVVEGVDLSVCSACAKHGAVKHNYSSSARRTKLRTQEGPELKITSAFAEKIRSLRVKQGRTQEEFAALLNQRVSILTKWEQGTLKPPLEEAEQLGKKLGVNFVEQEQLVEQEKSEPKKMNAPLTIGDFVKIKKRS